MIAEIDSGDPREVGCRLAGMLVGVNRVDQLAQAQWNRCVGPAGETHDRKSSRQRHLVAPGNQSPNFTSLPSNRRQFLS